MCSLRCRTQLFFLFMLLPWLATQCGSGKEEAKSGVIPAATVHWITWDLNSQVETLLVKRFQEKYPQIEFKREEANAAPTFYLTHPPLPDIINSNAGLDLAQVIHTNQVADLTEIWTQAKLFDTVPASIKTLSVHDGKQYYVPVGFSWEAIYYNKQIFAQYGLQPPQTWTEFMTLCDTLLRNGETPLALSGAGDTGHFWFEYLDVRLNGAAFHRALLAGQEPYDDARVRQVLATWQELFARGYFVKDPQFVGDLESLTALVRSDKGMLNPQKAVMVLSDTYNVGTLPPIFQAELGFFRFPVMDQAIPVAEVIDPFGYVVTIGAAHLPATMAFLTQLSSVDAQTLMAQNGMFQGIKYAPARADVAADRLSADQRQVLAMLKQAADAVLPLYRATPREVLDTMDYQFAAFIREPKAIDSFLQKFEEIRQQIVEQGKAKNE